MYVTDHRHHRKLWHWVLGTDRRTVRFFLNLRTYFGQFPLQAFLIQSSNELSLFDVCLISDDLLHRSLSVTAGSIIWVSANRQASLPEWARCRPKMTGAASTLVSTYRNERKIRLQCACVCDRRAARVWLVFGWPYPGRPSDPQKFHGQSARACASTVCVCMCSVTWDARLLDVDYVNISDVDFDFGTTDQADKELAKTARRMVNKHWKKRVSGRSLGNRPRCHCRS